MNAVTTEAVTQKEAVATPAAEQVVDQVPAEAQAATSEAPKEIHPNADVYNDLKEFTFRFKKDKMDNKRANVELKLPVPSVEGIVQILERGGKELDLLHEAIYDTVRGVASEIVGADEKISQETFPIDKIYWKAIAEMPKEDRRSSTISQETWAEFAKDYIEIMPGLTNKTVEAVTNATIVYLKKFSIVKTDKKTLKKLQEQLALYTDHTKKGEDFAEILELLTRRLETYLAADDIAVLTSNL